MQERWQNLPNNRQDDLMYFVTMRLEDALPASKVKQWQWEQANLSGEEQRSYVAKRMEAWLDQGEGQCVLERRGAAEAVETVLKQGDGSKYLLDEYVVMPNHAHVLVMPLKGGKLAEIVHAWKMTSAQEINRPLMRGGALWELEPFDHVVRGMTGLETFRQYIRNNPSQQPDRRSVVGKGSFAERTGM